MLIVMTMDPPPRLLPASPSTMMLALSIMKALSGKLYLAVFIASIVSQKHERRQINPTDSVKEELQDSGNMHFAGVEIDCLWVFFYLAFVGYE